MTDYWQHASWSHERLVIADMSGELRAEVRGWLESVDLAPDDVKFLAITYAGQHGESTTQVHASCLVRDDAGHAIFDFAAAEHQTRPVIVDVGPAWPSLPWIMATLSSQTIGGSLGHGAEVKPSTGLLHVGETS